MNIIEVLKKHQAWLNDEDGGSRAYLRGANLRGANLRGANLEFVMGNMREINSGKP